MAIIDRVEREARCGSVKILSAEIYNKQKKISLIFEHETVPDAEETERLKYYWKNKLKAGDAVQIEVRFRVPEANDPDEIPLPEEPPVFRQEPAAETVAVPFSIEEYEAAQKESIRQAARNMSGSAAAEGGYGGGSGTRVRKNRGEYNNRGDGKYSKKKKLTPAEGEELRKDSHGNKIYLGTEIDSVISKMSEIDADSGYVAVSGKIFRYEDRKIPSGAYIAMLEMTDNTYSVVTKFFFDEFDLKFVRATFKEGGYITVYGQASQDKYTRELTIMARSITEFKPVFRQDNAPVKRVELHLHTNMSAQDGLTRPAELVKQLVKWGHEAVAITDHGTAQAYPDMFNAMKKATAKGEPTR